MNLWSEKLAPTCAILAAVLAIAIAVAYVRRIAIAEGIAAFLITPDVIERADLIYVLNGEHGLRPLEAARLYRLHLADKVVIARARDSQAIDPTASANESTLNVQALERSGVPASSIEVIDSDGGVASTYDEAQALAHYQRSVGTVSKVIVVTSEFHSRRARSIFRKVLAASGVKVMVDVAEDPQGRRYKWWTSDNGIVACENEYLKLLWYSIRY